MTANDKIGFDYIYFDIPGGGIQTIAPTSALPEIYEPVFLDATTQPGYTNKPVVEVRGDNAGELRTVWFSRTEATIRLLRE